MNSTTSNTTLDLSFVEGHNYDELSFRFTLIALSGYIHARGLMPDHCFEKVRLHGRWFRVFNERDHHGLCMLCSLVSLRQKFFDKKIQHLKLITFNTNTNLVTDKLTLSFSRSENTLDTSTVTSNDSEEVSSSLVMEIYKICSLGETLKNAERHVSPPYIKQMYLDITSDKQPRVERVALNTSAAHSETSSRTGKYATDETTKGSKRRITAPFAPPKSIVQQSPPSFFHYFHPAQIVYQNPLQYSTHVISSIATFNGIEINTFYEAVPEVQPKMDHIINEAFGVLENFDPNMSIGF